MSQFPSWIHRSGKLAVFSAKTLILLLFMQGALMAESAPKKQDAKVSGKSTQADTVGEISIVGSTELPNVSFPLPWRLPSVEKREEGSPPREISGTLGHLEPKRHRQQVHFDRYLEVEMPSYQVK